jgi:hypothetical protein
MSDEEQTSKPDQILKGIADGRQLKDIAAGLNVSKQYVDQVINKMVADGRLIRVGRGKYIDVASACKYSGKVAMKFENGRSTGKCPMCGATITHSISSGAGAPNE